MVMGVANVVQEVSVEKSVVLAVPVTPFAEVATTV